MKVNRLRNAALYFIVKDIKRERWGKEGEERGKREGRDGEKIGKREGREKEEMRKRGGVENWKWKIENGELKKDKG